MADAIGVLPFCVAAAMERVEAATVRKPAGVDRNDLRTLLAGLRAALERERVLTEALATFQQMRELLELANPTNDIDAFFNAFEQIKQDAARLQTLTVPSAGEAIWRIWQTSKDVQTFDAAFQRWLTEVALTEPRA